VFERRYTPLKSRKARESTHIERTHPSSQPRTRDKHFGRARDSATRRGTYFGRGLLEGGLNGADLLPGARRELADDELKEGGALAAFGLEDLAQRRETCVKVAQRA
jgi:hypothetical protein